MQAVVSAMTSEPRLAGRRGGSAVARNIAIVAGLLSLCLVGFIIAVVVTGTNPIQIGGGSPRAESTSPSQSWIAAAPGRIEPRSGMIRLGTSLPGRVDAVPVNMNDRVVDGEVLMRLDDKEARARHAAATADADRRKRERDAAPATAGRDSISKAEDAVFARERDVMSARFELDDVITSNRRNSNPTNLANARRRLSDAQERLRQEQASFASAQNRNAPLPTALEAALIAARADVNATKSVLDKTRIRAPIAGTVLQVNAKVGELVAPSPEFPLVLMGDMSIVRVRAEVDEADVSKIRKDHRVYAKSSAHPGKDFEGKVVELAPSLGAPRMGSRGARRPTDVEVQEVVIDLDGNVQQQLLPGMRVDVYFRR